MGRLFLTALQAVHVASLGGAWRGFERAAAGPARAQAARLEAILAANAETAYGREHRFCAIASVADFQRKVPVVDYDALSPWIDRIARGESGVLTGDPVRMMEYSGGSTSTNKLIPYTKGLLAEFAAATSPWLYDLYRSRPGLWGTRSYWSISPVSQDRRTTAGGLPIGMADDTEYFDSPLTRWALRRLLAVPSVVVRLPDMTEWRRATLDHLLRAEDLGLISVWSPTFLSRLMQALADDFDELLAGLPTRRAREIRRAVDRTGGLTGRAIWPRLALISCWTDGGAKDFMPELTRWFPGVAIQGKGLLATEGVVSFPLWGKPGAVAAVAGHFLEFVDLEHPSRSPLLAPDLRVGGRYSPLLTTSGGLYRYHLRDEVCCVGRYREAPLLRFEGKLDRVSDVCGEKLNVRQIDQALDLARAQCGLRHRFALLAPIRPGGGSPPCYCLFLETESDSGTVERAARVVEEYLATGHHYRYCRALGQLGSLRVRRVKDGWEVYERTLRGLGQRAGDIKPTHLDNRWIWDDAYSACPEEAADPGKRSNRLSAPPASAHLGTAEDPEREPGPPKERERVGR